MSKYIHYGHNKFCKEKFDAIENRLFFNKPLGGLWASPVNAAFGWKDWNDREDFRLYSENDRFTFELTEGAKVFHIRKPEDLKKMPMQKLDVELRYTKFPDFEQMAEKYDAVELHLSECYALDIFLGGYDCDCILVLNPDVIRPIEEL